MKFSLEVGGVETIFPKCEMFIKADKPSVLFLFSELSEEDYKIFDDANTRILHLDRKNGVISLHIKKYNKQFSLELEPQSAVYDLSNICFSYRDTNGKRREKIYCFHR